MSTSTIARTNVSLQQSASIDTKQVYEYALVLNHPDNNDTQLLTAAFDSLPTLQDWQSWLSGWISQGYALQAQPLLVRVI